MRHLKKITLAVFSAFFPCTFFIIYAKYFIVFWSFAENKPFLALIYKNLIPTITLAASAEGDTNLTYAAEQCARY